MRRAVAHNERITCGCPMSQADLFTDENLQAPRWRADLEKVRARLTRILAEARAARSNPWSPAQTHLYQTIVPNMTRWLPAAEAADWIDQFNREMNRLLDAA